jgi:hypothetical protein
MWIFVEPDDYQAKLSQANFEILLTGSGTFKTRLTSSSLHHLHLLSCEEELPRVAHVRLPWAWSFVTLTTPDSSPMFYNGIELRAGDLLVHARGECFFQRTMGPCAWVLLAVTPLYPLRRHDLLQLLRILVPAVLRRKRHLLPGRRRALGPMRVGLRADFRDTLRRKTIGR